MVYLIRRFLKGQKQSGTQDIWSGSEPMTDTDFSTFSELFGEGKYLMCVRGKGIRGFRKLAEHHVSPKKLIFAAEENVVSVQPAHPIRTETSEYLQVVDVPFPLQLAADAPYVSGLSM